MAACERDLVLLTAASEHFGEPRCGERGRALARDWLLRPPG